ncbi:hypothetical protein [Massilia sp. BKSP1R2A-1]|uniref:hypothetical protein n=1 Tax=Massilia sp. BKSP1R2A-1 TaxID=3422595 RepID=UPI003D3424B4
MTVIVCVKINDGIVMAADSVSSYANGMTYSHANKIVNLWSGHPVGAMVTGDGGIGNESIETLFKDLRRRFDGKDPAFEHWKLDPTRTTIQDIAAKARDFLVHEKVSLQSYPSNLLVRICGYSAMRPLSETWDLRISSAQNVAPEIVQSETDWGIRWEGEFEALDRLIIGLGTDAMGVAMRDFGMAIDEARAARDKLSAGLYKHLVLPGMPIQDAVNLARFLVETTIGFVKYSIDRPNKTVGGPIEIAAITKHEGFRWVQRKHFYPKDLNS